MDAILQLSLNFLVLPKKLKTIKVIKKCIAVFLSKKQ